MTLVQIIYPHRSEAFSASIRRSQSRLARYAWVAVAIGIMGSGLSVYGKLDPSLANNHVALIALFGVIGLVVAAILAVLAYSWVDKRLQKARRRRFMGPGVRWVSDPGRYLGPFGGDGLPGCEALTGDGTAVRLFLYDSGVEFRADDDPSRAVTCPYQCLRSVEVHDFPSADPAYGQLVFTTADGQTAIFDGRPGNAASQADLESQDFGHFLQASATATEAWRQLCTLGARQTFSG